MFDQEVETGALRETEVPCSGILLHGRRTKVLGRFLRLDLPRACFVYEVAEMAMDAPLWGLICQVHWSAGLIVASYTAPSNETRAASLDDRVPWADRLIDRDLSSFFPAMPCHYAR